MIILKTNCTYQFSTFRDIVSVSSSIGVDFDACTVDAENIRIDFYKPLIPHLHTPYFCFTDDNLYFLFFKFIHCILIISRNLEASKYKAFRFLFYKIPHFFVKNT